MKIGVFGTGYVGLITAVGLANTGKQVICIDNDLDKVQKINKGISPIYEPGLNELLIKNKDRIDITTDAKSAIIESDVIIIAVGTPFDGEHIDLTFIKQAAIEIGEAIANTDDYKIIVVKSTVVPETTLKVVKPLVLEKSGKSEDKVGFAMNPEFLREGNAVEDFLNPDRIVLGVSSEKVEAVLREVYDGYGKVDIVVTNITTAEMIKYAANSFLALTISYANEIARICELLTGVDSQEVFNGVILDKRFSPIIDELRIIPKLSDYLRAGIGFGGSCFPKDVKALNSFAIDKGLESDILQALLKVNNSQLKHVFNLGLNAHYGKVQKIAILGTAFKPDTDDIRESPGIKLAQLALEYNFKVIAHDYVALANTKKHFGDLLEYTDDPMLAVKGADLVFVTTIWEKYLDYSDEDYQAAMKDNTLIIDTRSHFTSRLKQPWRLRIGLGD
ncbi:MAG: UDP-glucose/GDP-mannose dehydrogenase family protein [Mariniphaga sp.]